MGNEEIKNAKALYITAGGGVGDFIYHYFRNDSWKYIEPIKRQFPNITICALVACHVSGADELIVKNPHIDSIIKCKWYPPGHKKEHYWKNFLSDKCYHVKKFAQAHNIKPQDQRLYLTLDEEKQAKQLLSVPSVVIHPFGGLPHRSCIRHPHNGKYFCYPDYKYKELCNELTKKGYQVIILGRGEKTLTGPRKYKEQLDISGDKIINLIDKTSLRLSVHLTREAQGFIGAHSSMLSAAWTNEVPSIFFYPGEDSHGNKRSVITHGGETGTWALKQPWNAYYEMSGEAFTHLSHQSIINKLFELMGKKGK